ncbi:MAG: hypothetical protein KH230_17130 [Enterocloster asparagiformis]|nr:hypothetical protein [Enterocloster asparagiformis]
MSKGYKILVSTLAVIFSLLAACIGYAFAGGSDLTFWKRYICNFIFIMQFLATIWCVIALFKRAEKQ